MELYYVCDGLPGCVLCSIVADPASWHPPELRLYKSSAAGYHVVLYLVNDASLWHASQTNDVCLALKYSLQLRLYCFGMEAENTVYFYNVSFVTIYLVLLNGYCGQQLVGVTVSY